MLTGRLINAKQDAQVMMQAINQPTQITLTNDV